MDILNDKQMEAIFSLVNARDCFILPTGYCYINTLSSWRDKL